jgi:hypothetical protein
MPEDVRERGADETFASAYAEAQAREAETAATTHPEAQAGVPGDRSYPSQGTHYHQKRTSAGVGVPDNEVIPDDSSATHETGDDAFLSDQEESIDWVPDHDRMPPNDGPAFEPRTASDWIASAATPEFISDICRKGLHLKAMQHLVAVLDFAQQQGVNDAGLYEAIEIASNRAAHRGKDSLPEPLNGLTPGVALSKLRSILILVLGDDFNVKHGDYERLKQRRSDARARRGQQDRAKPSKPAVNAYAAAQGRDPTATDESSDPDDPPF